MSRAQFQVQRRVNKHTHPDDGDVTYDWRDCVSNLKAKGRPYGPTPNEDQARAAMATAQSNYPDEVYRIVVLT